MDTRTLLRKFVLFSIFFFIVGALSSCSRMGESSLKLQANPILTGGLGWAVVKDAYVRLKESPSSSSRDVNHLRRGSLYRLDARELGALDASARGAASKGGDPGIWYGLESDGVKGWVLEEELDIFASQVQAEKAAAAYR
jgi:hypothetical protein